MMMMVMRSMVWFPLVSALLRVTNSQALKSSYDHLPLVNVSLGLGTLLMPLHYFPGSFLSSFQTFHLAISLFSYTVSESLGTTEGFLSSFAGWRCLQLLKGRSRSVNVFFKASCCLKQRLTEENISGWQKTKSSSHLGSEAFCAGVCTCSACRSRCLCVRAEDRQQLHLSSLGIVHPWGVSFLRFGITRWTCLG